MSGPEDPAHAGAPGAGAAPSEEELRAAYEAELARITAVDMIAQSAVSLLNIGARRLGSPSGEEGAAQDPERDLEQARDAIDAARALLEILERRLPREIAPLKDALSQLQMAYAKEVGAGGGDGGSAGSGGGGSSGGTPPAEPEPPKPGERSPGPAQSSGRLWVPGQ